MKRIAIILAGLLGAQASWAQEPTAADSTGLPGDNFSLQGALELFSKSKDLDAFEKALNTSENKVNNLDLDGDGEVDYVRVVDLGKDNVHVITLRVPVSKSESQDVAVIEVEKTGEQSARALIRGDALLYGDSLLLEPTAEVMKQAKGAGGPDMGEAYPMHVWVNVWGWPSVTWMYAPSYAWWDSPWYWGYYPTWYRPWRPWGWRSWWGYSYHYNSWCRPVYYDQPTQASVIYAPRRSMSSRVVNNTRPVREARAASGARSPMLGSARPGGNVERNNMRNAEGRDAQRPVQRPGGRTDQATPGRTMDGAGQGRPSTTDRTTDGNARPNVDRQQPSRTRETKPSRQARPSREVTPSQQGGRQPAARPSAPQRQAAPSRQASPSRGSAPARQSSPSRSAPRGR